MPFTIIRQDITRVSADAIVSAGNRELKMEGGVSGAIFRAAGEKELSEACAPLAPVETSQAVATPAFKLSAKYIIHTVGPVYRALFPSRARTLLHNTYINALNLALELGCESVALPLISAGHFGYPSGMALEGARSAVREFLEKHEMDITLCVFGDEAFRLSESLMGGVQSYIDRNYIEEQQYFESRLPSSGSGAPRQRINYSRSPGLPFSDEDASFAPAPAAAEPLYKYSEAPMHAMDLEGYLKDMDESFSQSLLKIIDEKGKSDVEVYKGANLDRRLFSKIRSNTGYSPSKKTVLALAVSLELSLGETRSLLSKAGYSLSHSILFDVIVEYFISSGIYDIFTINEVLFAHDQLLLGS